MLDFNHINGNCHFQPGESKLFLLHNSQNFLIAVLFWEEKEWRFKTKDPVLSQDERNKVLAQAKEFYPHGI